MLISEKIFYYIEKNQLTQKEFSERTGISQSTISDWKRKKTNPASDKIMVICEVLGITPYELLNGTESGGRSIDYLVISPESEDYSILEQYHALSEKKKGRLLGYLEAISEK